MATKYRDEIKRWKSKRQGTTDILAGVLGSLCWLLICWGSLGAVAIIKGIVSGREMGVIIAGMILAFAFGATALLALTISGALWPWHITSSDREEWVAEQIIELREKHGPAQL